MKGTIATLAAVLAAAAGCQSPPEDAGCPARPGESSVEFDCQPAPGEEWEEQAQEEAVEGMDERGPGSRP